MATSKQREFTRVPLQVRAEVQGSGVFITSTATQNLSLKGLFVTCSEQLPEGTICRITLLLGEGTVRIETEATVIRCHPEGIAFQFTRIDGLESYEHLRNLLLYNAPDPTQVEGEFDASVGIHKQE